MSLWTDAIASSPALARAVVAYRSEYSPARSNVAAGILCILYEALDLAFDETDSLFRDLSDARRLLRNAHGASVHEAMQTVVDACEIDLADAIVKLDDAERKCAARIARTAEQNGSFQ
jgi:hypothetical protein